LCSKINESDLPRVTSAFFEQIEKID